MAIHSLDTEFINNLNFIINSFTWIVAIFTRYTLDLINILNLTTYSHDRAIIDIFNENINAGKFDMCSKTVTSKDELKKYRYINPYSN
jgi:hypothetical protein